MKRKTILYLIISLIAGGNFSYSQTDALTAAKLIDITEHGAVGDGETDNTAIIQEVINKAIVGDTILIPDGNFRVRTLFLKTGVSMRSTGILTQHSSTKTGNFSLEKQNSPNPLLKGEGVTDLTISIKAETKNEAIYLIRAKNILIHKAELKGDSTKLLSYPGISLFKCSGVTITSSKISHYGMPRKETHSYQPGTGIRVFSSNTISIRDSEIFRNGENGIFVHGSRKVEALNNTIHHNGMSAIQVAFGSSGKEGDYIFSKNLFDENASDGIDINNRSPEKAKDIACIITENISCGNGFVDGKSTPDGSGIATLINVSNVIMYKNRAFGNNRPAIYVESCDVILAKENHADNQVEVVLDLGEMLLDSNKFGSINLMANVRAEKLTISNNEFGSLSLPNGIEVSQFIIEKNTIKNASLNFNMGAGNIRMMGNKVSSNSPNGAILLTKANSILLQDNEIESKNATAITIKNSAQKVRLIKNTIRSASVCVMDDNSTDLLVEGNKLTILPGGEGNQTILSHYPNQLKLKGNEHIGLEDGGTIKMVGTGQATLIGEKISRGTTDFGRVEISEY